MASLEAEAAWGRCHEDGEGGDERVMRGPHMSLRWTLASYVVVNANVAWLTRSTLDKIAPPASRC